LILFIKHTTKTYNERIRWWNWDSVEKLESPKKMVTWPQVLVDRTQHPPFLNCFPYFHGLEICKTAIICRFLIAQVDWYVDMYIEIPFSDCISQSTDAIRKRYLYIHEIPHQFWRLPPLGAIFLSFIFMKTHLEHKFLSTRQKMSAIGKPSRGRARILADSAKKRDRK
jgi:hypothetical protein